MPPDVPSNVAAAILPALRRLDRVLERAVAAADALFGPEAADDPHRGLYVSPADVSRLLARAPADVAFGPAGERIAGDEPAWRRLADSFELDAFDLDVVAIAVAPEVDLRYERLYAYLQDDVTRRLPTVELALDLLCETGEEKLARRARLADDAPLLRYGVVRLVADPNATEPPLLACGVKLDSQVLASLLGGAGVARRLASVARLVTADAALAELPAPLRDGLARALRRAGDERRPLRLLLAGEAGSGRGRVAEAVATEAGGRLLAVDLAAALEEDAQLEWIPAAIAREARLHGASLLLEGVAALAEPERAAAAARLARELERHPGHVFLAGPTSAGRLELPGLVTVAVAGAGDARRHAWDGALSDAGVELAAEDVDALARRFRLTRARIAETVEAAVTAALLRDGGGARAGDVFAAARRRSAPSLGALARKLEPRFRWDDIVLPGDRLEQLAEICDYVRHRAVVYDHWGFERKLSLGKGLNVLFSGPSGTGKTMAAEIVAAQLALDLYRIDLSGVVSKYVGETEKNLARIFAEAEDSSAILFFDEADALFGKRTEVRDSHDRYANIEVSYLLQRMEEYEGIVILATNLRKNMDDAFVRRMHFSVEFPFPAEADRRRIWEAIWPAEAPRGEDVDPEGLARRFELAGGNIKNVALAAAFLAASDGRVVTMRHVLRATRREYQKLGKVVLDGEFDRPDREEEVHSALA